MRIECTSETHTNQIKTKDMQNIYIDFYRINKSTIDQYEKTLKTITTTRTIVNPFIMTFAEEEAYFAKAFAYCDADKSGKDQY